MPPGYSSYLQKTINSILKIVTIIIIPVGLLLFISQYFYSGQTYNEAILSTVAGIIGMIPEGLILLTSTVLAVSVIRLSKLKVLVQQLYCIETLARVDTICIDKTGTLTEGSMEVFDVVSLNNKYNIEEILSEYEQLSSIYVFQM